jgi:phosphate:Na+ symporter
MNWGFILFQTIGGIGLFLMGMKMMSDGLEKSAGDKLRKVLNLLTSNRFMGIFIGLSVTAVIQSSSAMTVMTVGFVNAGLITLRQAIGIVFGANIGTTITAWIIIIPVIKYAMVIIGVGALMSLIFKNEKIKFTGEVIFGLGILFLGLDTMGSGLKMMKDAEFIQQMFLAVNGTGIGTILLGVAVGTLVTMVIQSSSVTVSITIILATQGLINFEGAVSLILGDNIGTTITAILASLGASRNAKRTALAHLMFNVFGVILILILFIPFTRVVDMIIAGDPDFTIATAEQALSYGLKATDIGMKPMIGMHVAFAHSLFNITNVILFTGFIPVFVKICEFLIPITENEKLAAESLSFTFLDNSLIGSSTLAIAETQKELGVMGDIVIRSGKRLAQFVSTDVPLASDDLNSVEIMEKRIDDYQTHITEFLLKISQGSLSHQDSVIVGNYITYAHNLEKFADYCEKIAKILYKVQKKKLVLPKYAGPTISTILERVMLKLEHYTTIFKTDSKTENLLLEAQAGSKNLKEMISEAKIEHFNTMNVDISKEDASIYYIDILNSLDGMRSEIYNMAEISAGTKYL